MVVSGEMQHRSSLCSSAVELDGSADPGGWGKPLFSPEEILPGPLR
jgi:hypothetical protein